MSQLIYPIEQLEREFTGEWILGEVLEKDERGEPKQVKILAHSKVREDIYEKLREVPDGSKVTSMFFGPALKEGYAAAFLVTYEPSSSPF